MVDQDQERLAVQLGQVIASRGFHLLTGGGPGAMEVVCKAFTDVPNRPGRAIGIVPGDVSFKKGEYVRRPGYPNPYVEIPVYTHLPMSGSEGLLLQSRNHINILSSDVLVVLEGWDGTLAEANLAVRYEKPVIALLKDDKRMPGLNDLPIKKVTQVKDVEEFILQVRGDLLRPAFSLAQTRLPAHFIPPNF
jgi:uncharacterized protein (TIGR00725 family)